MLQLLQSVSWLGLAVSVHCGPRVSSHLVLMDLMNPSRHHFSTPKPWRCSLEPDARACSWPLTPSLVAPQDPTTPTRPTFSTPKHCLRPPRPDARACSWPLTPSLLAPQEPTTPTRLPQSTPKPWPGVGLRTQLAHGRGHHLLSPCRIQRLPYDPPCQRQSLGVGLRAQMPEVVRGR